MISSTDIGRIQSSAYNTSNLAGRAEAADTKKESATDGNDLANKDMFLQLLIAQIKNQDPTQPTDSIQYITQLNQFSSTEQLVSINDQMKKLVALYTPPKPETPAP